MQIIDCAANEVKYFGLRMNDAMEKYEKLGGKRMGYCIAQDDEVLFVTTKKTVVSSVSSASMVKDGFMF